MTVNERSPLIVGAGPAGLATAFALETAGLTPRVVERADRPGSSWYRHYDSLRLNSPRRWSSLPGRTMDRRLGRFVRRDDFIDYVTRYAKELSTPIDYGIAVERVERVERDSGAWRVDTSGGPVRAARVVVATGLNAVPRIPEWPGLDGFGGQLLHATEYRNAEPFRGRDVLVVGIGSTGTDISVDLARGGARRVRVAVRRPPIILRRSASTAPMTLLMKYGMSTPRLVDAITLWAHRTMWGDLTAYGLGAPHAGVATAVAQGGTGGTIDCGLISALRQGAIEVVSAVEGFDGPEVVLADGRIRPDVVIAATGQRPGLEPLVGHLGVLGPDGRPTVHGGESAAAARGLHFIGYRLPPGQLPDLRFDARAIARVAKRAAARAPVPAAASIDGTVRRSSRYDADHGGAPHSDVVDTSSEVAAS